MAEISPLRRRMIEDMTVRNLSPATQQSYLNAVSKFSRYFGRSPDRLGLEDVHAFQLHLVANPPDGRQEEPGGPGDIRHQPEQVIGGFGMSEFVEQAQPESPGLAWSIPTGRGSPRAGASRPSQARSFAARRCGASSRSAITSTSTSVRRWTRRVCASARRP